MKVGRRGADNGNSFPTVTSLICRPTGGVQGPHPGERMSAVGETPPVRGLSKAFEDMAKTQRVPVQEVFLRRRPHSSPTPSSSSTPPTPHTSQSHTHNSSSYAAADNPCSP